MLLELVVVVTLLGVILAAILTIADGTSKTAAADQERTNTLGDAQVGISRIADELRNACVFFGAGGIGSAGNYCRVDFTAAPGNSACTQSSDCVDAIINTRTTVTRPSGATTRGLVRVRINCGTADPASATQRECARYAVACSPTSPPGCPSPTALTGVLARSVTNFGATGSPMNVFIWCARETILSTAGTNSCTGIPATAGAVQISLAVARRGQRVTGNRGSFLLQEGVELKNLPENQDVS
jgi:type II secretory pathway pseudopilin PulG